MTLGLYNLQHLRTYVSVFFNLIILGWNPHKSVSYLTLLVKRWAMVKHFCNELLCKLWLFESLTKFLFRSQSWCEIIWWIWIHAPIDSPMLQQLQTRNSYVSSMAWFLPIVFLILPNYHQWNIGPGSLVYPFCSFNLWFSKNVQKLEDRRKNYHATL